jgi:hypothetical protein
MLDAQELLEHLANGFAENLACLVKRIGTCWYD